MIRPREALMRAVIDDLRPMVEKLREWGWPAEVRVESDGKSGRFVVLVEIRLDGMPVPVEVMGKSLKRSSTT